MRPEKDLKVVGRPSDEHSEVSSEKKKNNLNGEPSKNIFGCIEDFAARMSHRLNSVRELGRVGTHVD